MRQGVVAMDGVLCAKVTVREVARGIRVPLPARLIADLGHGKLRGLRRLPGKLRKFAYFAARSLKLPLHGEIALLSPGGDLRFRANFANTGYLPLARRQGVADHQPDVTGLFEVLAGRLGTVYDIGANWGYFSALLMTNPAFGGTIHAFEIAPRTFRDLESMVRQCGFADRVVCHPTGLSDRPGQVHITEGKHSGLTRVVERDSGGTPAPVDTLDSLDLPLPDLIKIDVEGHELPVLTGGKQLLARAKPLIVMENWYQEGDETRMLAPLWLLRDLGYRIYRFAWQCEEDGRRIFLPRRPVDSPGGANVLAVVPMEIEARPLIPAALDVVALHPDRSPAMLDGIFTELAG
jgi:FkbM family methyltransferase